MNTAPFKEHVAEYEDWFEKNPLVFDTELNAIRKIWPAGEGLMSLEVGSGTGRFSSALNIRCGLEPCPNMDARAMERGMETVRGRAEDMPFLDEQFDVVLINSAISYFSNANRALREAYRVLKSGGTLILGFIPKNSRLGVMKEKKKEERIFGKAATLYAVEEVVEKLESAGFHQLQFYQTLFKDPDDLKENEPLLPGYGQGSYVFIKAIK